MITKYYRVERITHRPLDEDKITVIKEVKENDLKLARRLATKCYLEALKELQGKYSPACYDSYDITKGIGFNYQLLLLDVIDEEVHVVESTMNKIEPAIVAQTLEEKQIFLSLGLDCSSLRI